MGRIDELLETSDKIIIDRFSMRIEQIQDYINNNLKSIVEGFIKTFSNLFKEANELQKQAIKDKVAIINISFLYSNILLNKYAVQINVYDKQFYLDKVEISSDLDLSYLFQFIEEDMVYIKKELGKRFIRLKDYELVNIRTKYIVRYYKLAEYLIRDLVPYIQRIKEFKKIDKENRVIVLWGEYMGSFSCIQELQEEAIRN